MSDQQAQPDEDPRQKNVGDQQPEEQPEQVDEEGREPDTDEDD
jgi:hypothetical protein